MIVCRSSYLINYLQILLIISYLSIDNGNKNYIYLFIIIIYKEKKKNSR